MTEDNNLNEQVKSISSQSEFTLFVQSLISDLEKNPDDWVNVTLTQYLDAVAAWVEDMEGYFDNSNEAMPSNIDWKMFAQILLAAKYYE